MIATKQNSDQALAPFERHGTDSRVSLCWVGGEVFPVRVANWSWLSVTWAGSEAEECEYQVAQAWGGQRAQAQDLQQVVSGRSQSSVRFFMAVSLRFP